MRVNVIRLSILLLCGLLAAVHNSRAGDRLAWTGGVSQIEGAAGGGLVPWALIGKVKIAGDAVFSPDVWLPQISAGAQYKHTLSFDEIPRAIGARKAADVDFYIAATKLYFAAVAGRNLLVDFTVRRTRANQFGLLGFGGDQRSRFSYEPEGSIAVFLARDILFGGEYRAKPSDLGAFREDDAHDIFVAWNPFKPLTLTLAYLDLGRIAGKSGQKGVYASLWAGF